jgi:DNA repair protein RadC
VSAAERPSFIYKTYWDLKMSIKNWPVTERPREKLLAQGASHLSDAELLAIFLRTGMRGKTALDLGRNLLSEFGSLRQIVEAAPQQFCKTPGLGVVKYTLLQAAIEIAQRYLRENMQRQNVISNPQDSRDYLSARLRHRDHEVFACLFLDNAHRVIGYEELFHGTINSATVYPREVVKRALNHNAASIILAHNHPSGIAEPSIGDRHITQQLQQALRLIDVKVIDHIVVGDGQIRSFAEMGLL